MLLAVTFWRASPGNLEPGAQSNLRCHFAISLFWWEEENGHFVTWRENNVRGFAHLLTTDGRHGLEN